MNTRINDHKKYYFRYIYISIYIYCCYTVLEMVYLYFHIDTHISSHFLRNPFQIKLLYCTCFQNNKTHFSTTT